jgi:predicted porin
MSNIVSNNVSANLSNSAGQFTLGSAFGQSKVDKVTNTTFEKGEFLGDFVVYYSTKEELIKMGVKFTKENKVALPKAFQNFCVPPDGWVE